MPIAIDVLIKKILPLLVVGIPAISMFIFIVIVIRVFFFKNRNRKNPLTENLFRSPGQTLLNQITDLQFKSMEIVFFWCFIPILVYAIFLNAILAQKSLVLFLMILVTIIASLYGALRTYAALKRLADLRLAYDGELSVGQELNDLMFDGFRVFHDIKAKDFNIDHAIVGSSGVFAIETKTRSKRLDAKGADSVEVLYDGDSINFPHWKDTEILEQAKGNAQWLSEKLTEAVGEEVKVFPAVAIPGWFIIKTTKKYGPVVYNGKNPKAIFPKCGQNKPLAEDKIQRIAYQIEQLCRNVEPITFNQEKQP